MNSMILCLYIRLLYGFLDTTYGCNEGWTLFPRLKYCYRAMQPPLTWEEARASCSSHKANLVKLLDWDEQRFLSVEFLGSVKAHGVWIGATDRAFPHQWKWFDGSIFNKALYKWIPGNPDNNGAVINNIADSEDCIEMSAYSNNVQGLLNDYKCDTRLPYICEIESGEIYSSIPTTLSQTTSHRSITLPPEPTVNQTLIWVVCVSILVGVLIVTVVFVYIVWRRKRHQQKDVDKDKQSMIQNISVHMYSEVDSNTERPNEPSLVIADLNTNNYEDTHSEHRNITEHQYTEINDSTKEIVQHAEENTDCKPNNYESTLAVHRDISENMYSELENTIKHSTEDPVKKSDSIVEQYEKIPTESRTIPDHVYSALDNPSTKSSDGIAKTIDLHSAEKQDIKYDQSRYSTGSAYCEVLAANNAVTVNQNPNNDAKECKNNKLTNV